jgi:predicted Holliday junction resolvase-like endonuclease
MEQVFLIVILLVVALVAGYAIGRKSAEDKFPQMKKEAVEKSRSTLGGQFSEQLAPYLPDFPFSPTEARFIGKPIDFLVFKGADEKNITEVVFVEVKSGKSHLNETERGLRDAINEKKVSWQEYKVPEAVTKKPEDAMGSAS